MRTGFCAVVVLLLGCGGPQEATSQTRRVDMAQTLADLAYLASDSLQGRETGTVGSRLARERIVRVFADAGLDAFVPGFDFPFPMDGGGTGHDVLALARGSTVPDRYLVVTAHYDHLGPGDGSIFNGADDNASGTAALLAFARYFGAHAPRHGVILAALDAEEEGLLGARAFVASPPVPLEQIVANVNMDMISHSDSLLFAAGTYHYPFLRPLLEQLPVRSPVVLRFGHDRPSEGHDDWTGASDHAPFHRAGIPFVYFGVEDHPDYHQPTDQFETINQSFYGAAVETILDAVLVLDGRLTNRNGGEGSEGR